MAFAITVQRVAEGPDDVQALIAFGEYDRADARLASMRQDLEELRAYVESRR